MKDEQVTERFKKPTDEQIIDICIIMLGGRIDPDRLGDMVSAINIVVDRLYENGDIMIPSKDEDDDTYE